MTENVDEKVDEIAEDADSLPSSDEPGEEVEATAERLDLSVDVTDAGPCRKHLKVTIPRPDIDRQFEKEFSTLVKSASVPGFRPGKTPRRLIERRYRKDVSGQVKASLLMASLEQIGDEQKIEPLNEPEIDVERIELPEEGDFVYEFEVEVRPEFDLPEYKGLRIERPTKDFSDEDIDRELQLFLTRNGEWKAKGGPVAKGDRILTDLRFMEGQEVVSEADDLSVQVDDDLFFKDGRIERFAEGMAGAEAGDSRELTAKLSMSLEREELAGKELTAVFVIKEVNESIRPEMNAEFFSSVGVGDEGELRDLVRATLVRRLEYRQFEATREHVMRQLVENADLELPRDLLRRQAEGTLRRQVMELRSAGFSDDEISARINRLRQDSMESTATSLKQQFVLQRIAEEENLTIEEADLENEVRAIAQRSGESPRRVRARVEKEGLWDSLGTQVLEAKTVQTILSHSELVDVPYVEEELRSSGLDKSAVPEPTVTESTESEPAESDSGEQESAAE